MDNNTNLLFSYSSDNLDLTIVDNKKIIRLLSEEFCIAVLSPLNTLEHVAHYSFSAGLSYKDKLKAIVSVDQQLNIACKEKIFRFYTLLNTQIPQQFYSPSENKTILSLLTQNTTEYSALAEEIKEWNIYTISAWDKELIKELKKYFPDYQLSSSLAFLLQQLAKQKQEDRILVFIENNNFTIIATNAKGLLGANVFSFATESDFLYYCLAFSQKMFPHISAIPFLLCGNIVEHSPLYKALHTYFSSLKILSCQASLQSKIENYSCFCDMFSGG
jgi:hypothetical protein